MKIVKIVGVLISSFGTGDGEAMDSLPSEVAFSLRMLRVLSMVHESEQSFKELEPSNAIWGYQRRARVLSRG